MNRVKLCESGQIWKNNSNPDGSGKKIRIHTHQNSRNAVRFSTWLLCSRFCLLNKWGCFYKIYDSKSVWLYIVSTGSVVFKIPYTHNFLVCRWGQRTKLCKKNSPAPTSPVRWVRLSHWLLLKGMSHEQCCRAALFLYGATPVETL